MRKKFIIIDEAYPKRPNDDIKWLCRVLGFSTQRDKSGLPVRILETILREERIGEKEMAERLGVSRTTISYHLEKMVLAGMIHKEKGTYFLAGNSLEEIIEDMKSDVLRTLERIKRISREIDRRFRLRGRA